MLKCLKAVWRSCIIIENNVVLQPKKYCIEKTHEKEIRLFVRTLGDGCGCIGTDSDPC